MRFEIDTIDSPLGTLNLVTGPSGVCALEFVSCRERMMADLCGRHADVELVRREDPGGYSTRLRGYLAGKPDPMTDIPVDAHGTEFQRAVWSALREIGYGETISYGELARRIGRPRASRAVGAANRSNPVAIIVPCHRVIGADGSLTGYAGGIQRKRWLLAREGGFRETGRRSTALGGPSLFPLTDSPRSTPD